MARRSAFWTGSWWRSLRRLLVPPLATSLLAAGMAATAPPASAGTSPGVASAAGPGAQQSVGSVTGGGVGGALGAVSEPVLVDELTTATSTTYLQPDGSYRSQVFATPVNFRDDSGDWQPMDNSLVPAPGAAYAVENAANDYQLLSRRMPPRARSALPRTRNG